MIAKGRGRAVARPCDVVEHDERIFPTAEGKVSAS